MVGLIDQLCDCVADSLLRIDNYAQNSLMTMSNWEFQRRNDCTLYRCMATVTMTFKSRDDFDAVGNGSRLLLKCKHHSKYFCCHFLPLPLIFIHSRVSSYRDDTNTHSIQPIHIRHPIAPYPKWNHYSHKTKVPEHTDSHSMFLWNEWGGDSKRYEIGWSKQSTGMLQESFWKMKP